MESFLNHIRSPEEKLPFWKQVVYSVCILVAGSFSGFISKMLDCTPSNRMPYFIEVLDIRNFLGRFAIWIFIAVCISIYSRSALRAALNVFLYFAGMITSYYLYSNFVAGFFPVNYALIWIGFTIISPLLAFICWYAKGNGPVSFLISAGIIAVLFNTAFSYGMVYIDVRNVLELILLILGIVILHRSAGETVFMTGISVCIAFIFHAILPFQFW